MGVKGVRIIEVSTVVLLIGRHYVGVYIHYLRGVEFLSEGIGVDQEERLVVGFTNLLAHIIPLRSNLQQGFLL